MSNEIIYTMDTNHNLEPTKSELEILQILWQHGPATVRLVNDELNARNRNIKYTAALKLMQIMFEKGLVVRDESQMKHLYSAAQEEKKTKGVILDRFIDTLYNGSTSNLMMQLLGNKKHLRRTLTRSGKC